MIVEMLLTAAAMMPPADDLPAPYEPAPVAKVCMGPLWGPEPECWAEPVYYAPPAPVDAADGISAAEFQWQGVVYDENGTRYTWYSQNVLPGGGLDELNANGRHVEGGYVVDDEGYIAVASSDHEIGTVLDTPFGQAKVYDTGCASGTVDVYVGWE